jgi:hypothetical protein
LSARTTVMAPAGRPKQEPLPTRVRPPLPIVAKNVALPRAFGVPL